MKCTFNVELIKSETISTLPNAWVNSQYRELLELMDYGDTADIVEDDLKEMCLMSLSEYTPEEAAEYVLKYIFQGRLNSGQMQNLSHEMQDEKMWEEYADLFLHEEFFNVGQLLYNAFNSKFPLPKALRIIIGISTKDVDDLNVFDSDTEMEVLKLLTQGMPEGTLIKRLFGDELKSGQFDEAKDIIWQINKEEARGNSLVFNIISSVYWLHDLKYFEPFKGELDV